MTLVACNIRPGSAASRERLVDHLRGGGSPPRLVLDTCQRLECFGRTLPAAEHLTVTSAWTAREAFERLARIAAGLESRILGELEVLGQVRRAYKSFREAGGQEVTRLDRTFQDALSLARKARRESGLDQGLTSLSGLAAREVLTRVPRREPVAVVGSGSLAGSVARYLVKRGDSPIRVASRCPERAMELAERVGGFGAGLNALAPLLKDVAGIVTATAAPHAVLYPRHLEGAHRPLTIVDLGEPADCAEEVQVAAGVEYIGLLAIEEKASINTGARRERAAIAGVIVREGADEWHRRFASRPAH